MAKFIERFAIEWYEVRAGRVRVMKGNPSHLKTNALRKLFEDEKLPVATSFWVTRNKCVHFKMNFPQDLREAVRAIVDP